MKRLARLGLLLAFYGCAIPFVHRNRERPQTPKAVLRFSADAEALTAFPGAPGLPEVTRSMSIAIDALPEVAGGDRLALEVRKKAEAMTQRPNETDALARASLDAALEAVRRVKPAVPEADKDRVVEVARRAIQKIEPGQRATLDIAYQEVARAMVVVTGGGAGAATGSALSQLVTRFAVEEPEDARRTGAQVIAAMGDRLTRLPHPPEHARRVAHELRKRAERLAAAAPLDYAGQLKDALSLLLGALEHAALPPPGPRLLDEARVAVNAIRADRPLDLQQAAVGEALRLAADAIAVSVSSHGSVAGVRGGRGRAGSASETAAGWCGG